MTITGYQFDRAKVSATKDSALYRALSRGEDFVLGDQGQELAVTVSGRNIRVGTGMALIQGRLVEVTATETVVAPSNSRIIRRKYRFWFLPQELILSRQSVGRLGIPLRDG